MEKRAWNMIGLFVSLLFFMVLGCDKRPPLAVPVEGFEAFPSARDFDPPGRVFRKDADGKTWPVGLLQVTPQSGKEETLAISKKEHVSLGGFLKSIGVAENILPAELKSKLNREIEVELESVSGTREYLDDDSGVYPAIAALFRRVPFKKDNEYYLIRETIASTEITFRSKVNWSAEFGADAEIKKIISANTEAKWGKENAVSMVKKFQSPLRIWYKAEKLVPMEALGIGPAEVPHFDLVNTTGELRLGIHQQPDNP